MTEKEIQEIKKKYNDILVSIESERTEAKNRMAELKQIPEVEEYISLCEKIKSMEEEDNTDVALFIADDIARNTKCSNKIYVNMGYYITSNGGTVSYSNPQSFKTIRVFIDLETLEVIEILKGEDEEFFKNNKIIHLHSGFSYFGLGHKKTWERYSTAFMILRNIFLKELIKNSQEETVDKFLNDSDYVKKLIREYREVKS